MDLTIIGSTWRKGKHCITQTLLNETEKLVIHLNESLQPGWVIKREKGRENVKHCSGAVLTPLLM